MTVTMSTLCNGLRIVTDSMDSVETIALGVWVGAGTRHETEELNGISHLLEHMAFKGTGRRTAREIAEQMDSVGGQLNAYTSRDHTAYYAKVLKEDVDLALDILSDILLHSTMDPVELIREQHVVVQEIMQTADTPDDIIFDHFQSVAFPDQPMGWPVLGSEEIVRSISSDALKTYLANSYSGTNMVISASGNIDHKDFFSKVEAVFSNVPDHGHEAPVPGRYVGGEYREARELEQIHLVLGFEGVPFSDLDYYNTAALSVLFGEGMSSRLFQQIREKRGLVYSIYSSTTSFEDSGIFSIYAGSGAGEVKELIPVLAEEISNVSETLESHEVERARTQLKAGLLMALESPSSRCIQRARQILVHGHPLSTEEIIKKVDSINIAGVKGAAKRIFQSPPTFACIGPVDAVEKLQELCARL